MKKTFVLLLTALTGGLYGQTSEVLTSDRPGQTFSANAVGKNVFQIQAGVGYDQLVIPTFLHHTASDELQLTKIAERTIYNSVNLRYGILNKLELGASVFSAYQSMEDAENIFNTQPNLNSDVLLSLRYNLVNTEHWAVGGMASAYITQSVLLVRAMATYAIDEHNSLNSNITYVNSDFNGNQLNYTLNFGHTFNNWGFLVESFGGLRLSSEAFRETDLLNYYDLGIWYLLNNNFQLDLTLGSGFNDLIYFSQIVEGNRFFAELGFTYRLL